MNPFAIYLYLIPGSIALASGFPKSKLIRVFLIILAAGVYWYIAPKYVEWAYSHPFNPNDGGPLAFSAVFGWLVGLVTLILPLHFCVIFCKWAVKKIKDQKSA